MGLLLPSSMIHHNNGARLEKSQSDSQWFWTEEAIAVEHRGAQRSTEETALRPDEMHHLGLADKVGESV